MYISGEFTTAAETLFKKSPEWTAPLLWRSEFRNILAGYMRRGDLTLEQACGIQSEAEDLMRNTECEIESIQVLGLVDDSDCSAYDCEFVALAKKLQVPLVTMDKKLLREFPDVAISLKT